MVTPAAAPTAETEPKARDAVSEPAAKSMSIAELQHRLTELGYKPGPADGKSGQRTTNALKKFQQDHKLPATGTLDAETIRALQKP
jgi:peptidoglycan hydrolase-like protein with peptidoglycan-binding domain